MKLSSHNGDYQVAIPSYQRARKCVSSTLEYLHRCGVAPAVITIFVADVNEAAQYRDVVPRDRYGSIVVGVKGMGAIRNFISSHYLPGTRLLNIDDDIECLFTNATSKKLIPVYEMDEVVSDAFELCEKNKMRLWGVYPVLNAMFMKQRVTFDLRYIIGSLWGCVVGADDVLKVSLDDKEDVERTIKCYLADGGVVRLEYLAPKTNYYKEPGGMQVERTEARVLESAKILVQRYPQLCALNLSKKSGHAEVRLKDRRGAQ